MLASLMGNWTQAGENLVRHKSGTIYLRCKVRGRIRMKSLKTDSLPEARKRRDAAHRALQGPSEGEGTRKTLKAVVDDLEAILVAPSLKESSRYYYGQLLTSLRKSLPLSMRAARFTAADARLWWEGFTSKYSPSRSNNALSLCKRMPFAGTNPFAGLRRMKQRPVVLRLPDRAGMEAVIAECKGGTALLVAFMAFSGLRRGEARAIRWEDIGDKWILVTGGKDGTKSRKVRRVPISPPLAAVIAKLRDGNPAPRGKVFHQRWCSDGLKAACLRLGMKPLRPHDLRHWFATHAVERGVDVPTVSRWLGHQDGGILAMRVYGHARDDHSLESAAKL